jgi:type II secretory pathway pseudopilin PulG
MRLPPGKQLLLGLVIGLVGLAVIIGLVVVGSPSEARARRLDERRVADLRRITRATDLYRTRHDRLPESLQELAQDPEVSLHARDPATGVSYEYQVLGPNTYAVCARFERADPAASYQDPESVAEDAWRHGVDRQCFRREARTDIRH